MAPATTSTSTRRSSIPRRRSFISGARTARRSFWRTWKTLKLGEFDSPQTARNVHFLTVYRQMKREQAMQFVIDAYIATRNGIRQEAHSALDQACKIGTHVRSLLYTSPHTLRFRPVVSFLHPTTTSERTAIPRSKSSSAPACSERWRDSRSLLPLPGMAGYSHLCYFETVRLIPCGMIKSTFRTSMTSKKSLRGILRRSRSGKTPSARKAAGAAWRHQSTRAHEDLRGEIVTGSEADEWLIGRI